jgi:hypothetical protein
MGREAGTPAVVAAAWRRLATSANRAIPRGKPRGSAPVRRVEPAPARPEGLSAALSDIRAAVATAVYPLATPSAPAATQTASELIDQLDDYVIPRLNRIDAPLLAVVGGSTGAGKSTLVNSLVRAPVSSAGVLRPTTRAPLLVCHPADASWFAQRSLLPGLARSGGGGEQTLQVVSAPALAAGLALLDAPDIDSVVEANRVLAHELFAAGDLWLFVTTAARYADAVPWRVLREARERGTAVAIVLDRVPPAVRDEISGHFARMLVEQGLGDAPLFTIAESTLDPYGLLPETEVTRVKRWLDTVAVSAAQRRQVTRRTLLGAVNAIGTRVRELARAADEQVGAAGALTDVVRVAYADAMSDVQGRVREGALLRGDVYTQWQELVATGDLRQALRAAAGPRRGRANVSLANRPAPGRRFQAAVAAAIAGLVCEVDAAAAQRCHDGWRAHSAGRPLLEADSGLGRPWLGFADAAHDLATGWQSWLRTVARLEAPRTRTRTRSFATASTVLLATIAALAPPPDDVTAAGAGPTLLLAVLRNEPARRLGERARAELLVRVGDLLGAEVDRHVAPVALSGVDAALGTRLRDAASGVDDAYAAISTRLGDAA